MTTTRRRYYRGGEPVESFERFGSAAGSASGVLPLLAAAISVLIVLALTGGERDVGVLLGLGIGFALAVRSNRRYLGSG